MKYDQTMHSLYNLTVLLKSLGGHATKNATGPVPQELHPHESALANEAQYRPPVSTSAFNLSLRGIELHFLPQVNSEIWRDRQTPKVLAKLQTSRTISSIII